MPSELIQGLQRAIEQLSKRVRALETNERTEVAGGAASLAFASLPAAGQRGRIIFVTNGRKAGEGVGLGTGVLAFDDGTNWIAVDTGLTVTV